MITRPDGQIVPEIHSGAGYNYTDEDKVTTFTATEPDSPIYFLTKDNVRTEMYYAGGYMKATIIVPESSVDAAYEHVVPTLAFMEKSSNEDGEEATHENIIDWYSGLTPDNRTKSGSPVNGVEWTTTWNLDDNGDVYYEIVITSNQTKTSGSNGSAIGTSLIIAPTSEVIANAKNDQGAVYTQIDLQLVRYYKSICPIAQID